MWWLSLARDILFGGKSILPQVKDIAESVWGSETQREANAHSEAVAAHEEHAAGYTYQAVNRNWFDSLIDGVNRLPRPLITFGVMFMFGCSFFAPASYERMMQALSTTPTSVWTIVAMVLGFWFTGRILAQDLAKTKPTKTESHQKAPHQERRPDQWRPF